MRRVSDQDDVLDAPDDRPTELDLVTLAQALWARKLRIVLPTLIVAILAAVTVQLITPEYKSTAGLLLQPQESSFTRPTVDTQGSASDQAIDDQAISSQVQVLKSRDLARRVITSLHLVGNPEFDPLSTGLGPVKRLMMSIGLIPDTANEAPEERVLDRYFEALSVYPMEKSRVLTVEFASKDPDLAAKAANTILDQFIEMQRAAKRSESLGASDALSPQIEALRQKVVAAEDAVERFRADNGLLASQTNGTLSTQQLTDIAAQVSAARAQQTESQTKAKLIRDAIEAGRAADFSEVTNNELIRRVVEQRVTLKAQLSQESQTLLPGHPRIKELRAQIAGLEAQLVQEAQRTVRALENDAKVAGARVASLETQLNGRKDDAARSNAQEVQLRALEREAKAQRDLLESYLSRFREASARASFQELPADARIISRAVASTTPYFPKKLPIIVIATLAALILSTAFLASAELMSGRPFRAAPAFAALRRSEPEETVPEPSGISLAARLRRLNEASERASRAVAAGAFASAVPAPVAVPVEAAEGEAADALAPIATALQRESPAPPPSPVPEASPQEAGRVSADPVAALVTRLAAAEAAQERAPLVLFVGENGGDVSAAACETARCLSERDRRAVLVDLATSETSQSGGAGLGELLSGEASFVDVIHRDRYSRLHLIPAGRTLAADPGTDIAERLRLVLDALAMSYDVVLVDAGASSPRHPGGRWPAVVPTTTLVATVSRNAPDAGTQTLGETVRRLGAPEVLPLKFDPAERLEAA